MHFVLHTQLRTSQTQAHFALASASAADKDCPCVCCLGVRGGCCPARGVREPDGAATTAAAAPAAAWACRPSGRMWSPARLAAASASGLTPVGDVGWWRSSATSHTSSTCTPLCHAYTNMQRVQGSCAQGCLEARHPTNNISLYRGCCFQLRQLQGRILANDKPKMDLERLSTRSQQKHHRSPG